MLRSVALAALAAVALSGLAAGCADVVETGPQAEAGEGFDEVAVTNPATTAPTSTSPGGSATLGFETGDCLTWEQGAAEVVFEVVACSEEHYAEVAGGGDLSSRFDESAAFPETDALSAAVAEVCNPIVEQYLGAPPGADVEPGVIPPTEASWAEGDRIAWCTLGLPREDARRPAYTGRIADGTAT